MDPAASLGSDVLAPGTILGRYEIRRLIGRGGMGSVYEGLHRDLKKRVAIKTLQAALAANPDAKVRFLREGEAASRIRHPHVVDVTDVGAEGAVIFLVMEYLEGEDLGKLIGRQGAMEVSATADIMLPVIAAIGSAHDQGVIHRDLKPENIFLARGQMGGIQPKVLDFGISKVSGDLRTMALTGTGATFGTTFYLPPEQLRGAKQADARSDQYALGTIIYECLTGQRAFEGDNLYAVLKDIAESRYRPALTLRPDLPPAVDAIVNRAMNLDPSTRFETTRHLGAALLEYATPQVRMMWTPFFGALSWSDLDGLPTSGDSYASGPLTPPPSAPMLGQLTPPPDAGAAGSPSSRHLRATPPPTDPPRASAGGTRVLPSGSTPFPRSPSTGGGGRRLESSSTFNHATGESASFQDLRPARSRLPLVVGLGALIAIGGVFLVMRPDGASDRPTAPAVAPEPKTYRVEIVTDPGSATIELDGQLVGTGAFARKLPLDGSEHEIVAKARGHRSASVRFTDVAPPRDLALEAIVVVEPPKPPPPPVVSDSNDGKGKGSDDRNDRAGSTGKLGKPGKPGKPGKGSSGKSSSGHHGSSPSTGPTPGDAPPSGNPPRPAKPPGKGGKGGDSSVLPNNAPIVD